MSVAGEKSIKFVFSIDQSSAQKAKNLILDLTRHVKNLADEATRAGRAMAGMGGRGTVMDRRPLGTFGNQAQHRQTHPGLGGGAIGMVNTLVGGSAGDLRGVAQATTSAFSSVASSLSTFTNRAESDVNRLQRSVDKLTRSLHNVNSPAALADTMISGGAGAPGGVKRGPLFNSSMPMPDWVTNPNPVAPKKPGMWSYDPHYQRPDGFRGYIGQRFEGIGQGLGLPPGASQGIGKIASRFAGAAGIGLGAIAAYELGAQAFEAQRGAQVNYTLNSPLQRMQGRAAVAAPFQQQFQAVHSGDVASQVAFRRALNNQDFRGSLDNVTLQREATLAQFEKMGLKGMASRLAQTAQGAVGNTFGDMMGWISGQQLTPAERRSALAIAQEQAMRGMGAEQSQKLMAAQQAEMATMNPRTAMLANQVYGGAQGRVSAMRMIGRSTANVIGPNGKPMAGYEALQSKLMAGGWSVEDYAQGYQQALGLGIRGSGAGGIGLVSAGIGGFHNYGQLIQSGGVLGGSVGSQQAWRKMLMRSVGRGGLDVAAGSQLFGGLSSMAMASGQFGGGSGGGAMMGAMAGLVGGGAGAPLDVAEQQRRTGMITSGLQAFGGFTSGQKAPLYQATSLAGAMGAMGGYGAGTEGLTKMSPLMAMNIARGGTIPEWAKGLGITQDASKKFLENQRRAPLFEVTDDLVGGDAGTLLKSIRGAEATGGSYLDVFKSQTRGMKGKKKAREFQRLSEQMGGVLFSQGLAASPEEGAGIFLSQAGADKDLAPLLKGRGVGAAAPQGLEKEALADQAKRMASSAEAIAKDVAKLVKLEGAFMGHETEEAALGGIAAAAGGQGADINTASLDLQSALARFTAAFNRSNGHGTPVKIRR